MTQASVASQTGHSGRSGRSGPESVLRRLARRWQAAREIEARSMRPTRDEELWAHEMRMAHWHLLLRR